VNYYYRSLYMTRFDSFVSSKLTCNSSFFFRVALLTIVSFVLSDILVRARVTSLSGFTDSWRNFTYVVYLDRWHININREFYYENINYLTCNEQYMLRIDVVHRPAFSVCWTLLIAIFECCTFIDNSNLKLYN